MEAASDQETPSDPVPPHPIRIAAQLHPQQGDYPPLRDAAIRAEELGYDIAYNWDHFFPLYGDRDGPHLECWTVLAAWAEATTTIEIGPLVACISYRNPHLLADMARTVDRISGGRVILGIGAGWKQRDYEEYGYEFDTMGRRIKAMGEAIPVIQRRLDVINPPPVRRMPLLIAGTGERRTLARRPVRRRLARGVPRPAGGARAPVAALRRWCDEVGRDPAEIEWGLGVEPEDIERFLARDAAVYVEMGFTQFTLGFNGPSWQVDGGVPFLRWRDEINARLGVAAEPRSG